MLIEKRPNGNVIVYDSNDDSKARASITDTPIIDAVRGDLVTTNYGRIPIKLDDLFLDDGQGSGPVEFTGDITDLVKILSDNFFFKVAEGGSGVETVSGGIVNNTDPLNPIIPIPLIPSEANNILVSDGNGGLIWEELDSDEISTFIINTDTTITPTLTQLDFDIDATNNPNFILQNGGFLYTGDNPINCIINVTANVLKTGGGAEGALNIGLGSGGNEPTKNAWRKFKPSEINARDLETPALIGISQIQPNIEYHVWVQEVGTGSLSIIDDDFNSPLLLSIGCIPTSITPLTPISNITDSESTIYDQSQVFSGVSVRYNETYDTVNTFDFTGFPDGLYILSYKMKYKSVNSDIGGYLDAIPIITYSETNGVTISNPNYISNVSSGGILSPSSIISSSGNNIILFIKFEDDVRFNFDLEIMTANTFNGER